MTMSLECRAITVAYDAGPVLNAVDLEVGPEEVVAVLGPSGSGKTTLLYAVAGFVDLVAGLSVREETDEATGIAQRIVSDWRSAPKGNELRHRGFAVAHQTRNEVALLRRPPARGRRG